MSRPIGTSPMTLDTNVYHFPDKDLSEELTIRVESGGSFKVHIVIDPDHLDANDPSSSRGDIFLDSGDAFTIKRGRALKGKDIKVKAITGTPKLFYLMR